MEITIIQHTFLKFYQSQKKQIFNKNPEPQIKQKNPRSSEKNSSCDTGDSALSDRKSVRCLTSWPCTDDCVNVTRKHSVMVFAAFSDWVAHLLRELNSTYQTTCRPIPVAD